MIQKTILTLFSAFSLLLFSNAWAGEVNAHSQFFCKNIEPLVAIAHADDDVRADIARASIGKGDCVFAHAPLTFTGEVIDTINGLNIVKLDDVELYVIGDANKLGNKDL